MFSPPATPTIAPIITFCSRRYNETNGPQHAVALGFMSIINLANDCQMESPDPELALAINAGLIFMLIDDRLLWLIPIGVVCGLGALAGVHVLFLWQDRL
jgi:hypothetical protein